MDSAPTRPQCIALLVSADERWLKEWGARLRRAESASEFDHGYSLQIEFAGSAEQACDRVRGLWQAQCVVVDGDSLVDAQDLLDRISRIRSELDLFLAVSAGAQTQLRDVLLLDRAETRGEVLWRRIHHAIAQRVSTPFADTLRQYVEGARDAWHTPGHSSGDGLRESPWVADFYRLMGEHVFNADLSVSVQELDSLLEPSHIIQQAQSLAAMAFGAQHTFFITGGTSTANKVVIQHLLGDGGTMLVDQACHKSIHHAAVLCGVRPVYLPASVNLEYGLYGPVAKSRIVQAIDENKEAALLVLTSCSYDGFYYDLAPLIAHAHAAGMKVLVDEAWYAHGYFHERLRPTALECGADYVTHSTHKTLSAFSQASMIHVSDSEFDELRFRENLNMHSSTSPQYGLIASLDVARKQMSLEGHACLSRCLAFAQQLRDGIDETGAFRVLQLDDMLPVELREDRIRLDPTKLTIATSNSGMSSVQLQKELYERYSIQVEKLTHNTLSILVTLGTTKSKVLRLINALQTLAEEHHDSASQVHSWAGTSPQLPPLAELIMLPRCAYFAACEYLPLSDDEGSLNEDLVDRVAADQVVPYPPGIPALVPGQGISKQSLNFLRETATGERGLEVHGLIHREGRYFLRVVNEDIAAANNA
ncbi:MAG: aminotransferase class V-fold PLP-dependent enzyme [Pseudomonadota bacterium]